MPEYIEREATKKSLKELILDCQKQNVNPDQIRSLYYALSLISEEPAADVAEVVRASWEWSRVCGQYGIYCTNCQAGWVDSENAEWIAHSHEYCPKCGAKMDKRKIENKGDKNVANISDPQKLSDTELSDLFAYCARLASMVSTADARRYYGFTFDGAVKDTFYGLAMLYANEGISQTADDFKSDELYGPTLQRMLADINRVLEEGVPQ